MGCSLKRGSPSDAKGQRGATGSTPVTRPAWPPGAPQTLRNRGFFAFLDGFGKCPDCDVGHDSATTPKMGTKQCVLPHFQNIFTPRMPRIYRVCTTFYDLSKTFFTPRMLRIYSVCTMSASMVHISVTSFCRTFPKQPLVAMGSQEATSAGR